MVICQNKHKCCKQCVDKIIKNKMTCPMCRSPILKAEVAKDRFSVGIFSIFGAIK